MHQCLSCTQKFELEETRNDFEKFTWQAKRRSQSHRNTSRNLNSLFYELGVRRDRNPRHLSTINTAFQGFSVVRGSASLRDGEDTVAVDFNSSPKYGEVVTRLPLRGFCVRVMRFEKPCNLTIGVIAPDDSCCWNKEPSTLFGTDGVHPGLAGTIWAWNLGTRSIYKRRLGRNSYSISKQLMPFSGDANEVKQGSLISVFRDNKTNAIHFSINGKDQGVALNQVPDSVHGFLCLRSQGREGTIGVMLLPEKIKVKEPPKTTEFNSGVPLPCKLIKACLKRRAKSRNRDAEEPGLQLSAPPLPPGLPQSPIVAVPSSPPREIPTSTQSSPASLIPGSLSSALSNNQSASQSPPPVSLVSDAPQLSRYEMNNRPRGICLIISNSHFRCNNTNREGTECDERELKRLFEDLHFKVHVKKDLQKNEMEKVAADYAAKDHRKFNAFVFIVMSHGGDRDVIYGVSGRKTRMEDLMVEFKSNFCPSLQNKPKLFIMQTCRGYQSDTNSVSSPVGSVNSCRDQFLMSWDSDVDVNHFSADSTLPRTVCPREADFLLAFATTPGHVAWRIPASGSLFIQALVEVIRTYHTHFHLLDMLTEVNRRVVEKQNQTMSDIAQITQVPAPTHTLRAQVFL